jgi:cytosine/adenosine deaminase-related metal-dependent hydrolase
MPVHRVVHFASGADVRDVVVGGDILMRDRVVPHVDEATIAEAANAETAQMLAQSGLTDMVAEDPGWGRTRRG